jgi:ABC-type branched-subunit amino acid transport system substrate-binding protein
MTVSVVATLGLGGAIAYEFAHHDTTLVPTALQTAAPETGVSAAAGGALSSSGGKLSSGGGTGGTSGTSGHFVGGGGSSGGGGTAGGSVSSNSGAAVGVNNGVITVGGIYDETGPLDATVERDTVRSYFDLVNSQGGVNGFKFQLVDCDSKYDPSAAHQCAQKLISQGVLGIVGWLSVSGEQSEAPFFNKNGIPMIGGLGVPSEYGLSLSYPTAPSLVRGGTALGDHAAQLGIKKPGVIILTADFAKPIEKALLAALHKNGIHEVDVEEVDATKADYTDVVLKLQQDGAQSIIAGLDPFSYARLFQAMERQNWHPPFLGGGLDKTSANKQYGSAVYGAQSITPVLEPADHMSTPSVKQYVGTVQKYFPSQVDALDVYTEYQWIAAEVFVDAVKQIKGNVTRASLVKGLNSISNFNDGGITKPISYSAGNSHDPLNCYQWIHNVKGHWKTYSGWNCF